MGGTNELLFISLVRSVITLNQKPFIQIRCSLKYYRCRNVRIVYVPDNRILNQFGINRRIIFHQRVDL